MQKGDVLVHDVVGLSERGSSAFAVTVATGCARTYGLAEEGKEKCEGNDIFLFLFLIYKYKTKKINDKTNRIFCSHKKYQGCL